jgi:hypothetical protein
MLLLVEASTTKLVARPASTTHRIVSPYDLAQASQSN